MAWIKAEPLKAGALIRDWYNYSITGLTPSTTYRYRSYFIVDGVEYRGVNTYTATTAAISYQVPTVTTGTPPINVNDGGFDVMTNSLVSDGGAPITEYGILYTQLTAFNTDATLIYGNYPAYVKKDSKLSTLSAPNSFSGRTSGLQSGTNTFYRAFAKNAIGVSYGQIYSQMTTNSTIQVSFLNAVEIDGYCSVATLQFLGHQPDTTYNITFTYYLTAECGNDNLPYGENFDNETRLEITKNNFGLITYFDNAFVEINDTQEYATQTTIPVPKPVTISNITDINNFKIKFVYNFDNYAGPFYTRQATGYIQISSIIAIRGGNVIPTQIVGNNRFSIRAVLSAT